MWTFFLVSLALLASVMHSPPYPCYGLGLRGRCWTAGAGVFPLPVPPLRPDFLSVAGCCTVLRSLRVSHTVGDWSVALFCLRQRCACLGEMSMCDSLVQRPTFFTWFIRTHNMHDCCGRTWSSTVCLSLTVVCVQLRGITTYGCCFWASS